METPTTNNEQQLALEELKIIRRMMERTADHMVKKVEWWHIAVLCTAGLLMSSEYPLRFEPGLYKYSGWPTHIATILIGVMAAYNAVTARRHHGLHSSQDRLKLFGALGLLLAMSVPAVGVICGLVILPGFVSFMMALVGSWLISAAAILRRPVVAIMGTVAILAGIIMTIDPGIVMIALGGWIILGVAMPFAVVKLTNSSPPLTEHAAAF